MIMLKFVATQNVARYRAQLNDEIDPARRIVLQRLLVEEEDRLGATFELLAEVRQAIADCKCQIAELRSLTENIEIDGRAAAVTSARLEALKDARTLHETYCQKLQTKLY
jgi:hypothetical protein